MEKATLTPEESLSLISKTIQETKTKFRESGHIYLMWGFLIFSVTLSQFILLQFEYYKIHWYPNFLYPFGGIYSYLYYQKKAKKIGVPISIIGSILKTFGIVLGVNFMLLGFLFSNRFGDLLAPVFIIFLAFWTIITGVSIKFKTLFICGLILNIMAFTTFFIDSYYQPLIMSTAAIIGFVIPGIMLNKDKNQDNV